MPPSPATTENEFIVDFPVLWVALDWIETHCVIPDRHERGKPYILADWQAWYFQNFYRIKRRAPLPTEERPAIGAPAFFYRRAQVVMPQKAGKGPMTAAHVCLEGVGPALFAGWAEGGEWYRCIDHGCFCGWSYQYQPGEPMGVPWSTPLIQITAFSEEQTGNVYDALRPMIEEGPLVDVIPRTGEEFIRLPGGGRIDTVTSSNQSRLGQRVTFVPQDEALALDTPLPTPTGWTTMGAVRAGDLLLGADGKPVRVVKATEVQFGRMCYRVTFQDGTSVVASNGHQWMTRVSASAARPKVRTTGEMVADGRRFRIPAADPYDLFDVDLPVDPYFLGLWLGDGSTGKPEIAAHNDEAVELQQHLADVGVEAYIRRNPDGRVATLCFSRKVGYQGSGRPVWAKALQAMSCYRSKHIPVEYLRGSIKQRTALLQGLMDSDGHCTETGFCTFAGNEQLCSDVVALLRTLAIQVNKVSRADSRARSGFGWKVNFTPRGDLQPFRLKRKAERVRSAWSGSDWIGVSIEPVESVPVRCVAVESDDHLFLAGEGGHVTHNTGIWLKQNKMDKVADTQRRGASGMQGRTAETTNAWDPAENSVAQRTAEAALVRKDIFRLHRTPPKNLRFTNKEDRRRIFRHVYAGSYWIDINAIEAECAEIMLNDPAQAERFYGNRIVAGLGTYLNEEIWDNATKSRIINHGTPVAVGFDGSDSDDWTAMTCTTEDGFSFIPQYGPDKRPTFWNPKEWGGEIPRGEIDAAMDEVFRKYRVRRVYADPHDWESEIDAWIVKYDEEIVIPWATYRIVPMHSALVRFRNDLKSQRATHDPHPMAKEHALRARKAAKPSDRYILVKPHQHQKIDILMATILGYEAASDLTVENLWGPQSKLTRVRGKIRSY